MAGYEKRASHQLLRPAIRLATKNTTPLLFLILSVWMMVYAIKGDYWKQAMMGLATVLGSGVVFFVASRIAGRKS